MRAMLPSSFIISQNNGGREKTRQVGQIATGFGVSGAHQNTALLGAHRKNMPGGYQVGGNGIGLGGGGDGLCSVMR